MSSNSFGQVVKVYRGQAKLCWQAVKSADSAKTPTLNLEASPGAPDDWSQKVVLQVTRLELPQVVGVLAGKLTGMDARFHGERRNRSYHLHWKGPNLAVSVSDAGKVINLVMNDQERFWVLGLACKQLSQALEMSVTDVLALLDTLAQGAPRSQPLSILDGA